LRLLSSKDSIRPIEKGCEVSAHPRESALRLEECHLS
jgi:hypothetical protein